MTKPHLSACLGLAVAASIAALTLPATAADPTTPAAEHDPSLSPMRSLIERYATDRAAIERSYHTPGSDQRFERLGRFIADEGQTLKTVNFTSLDHPGQIDYLLFQAKIKFDQEELEREHKQDQEITPLVPFAAAIRDLEAHRRKMEPINSESAGKTLAELITQVKQIRHDLESRKSSGATLPTNVLANRATKAVDDLRNTLKNWHEFYDGYDPTFSWWMRQPYPILDKDLADYASFLRKSLAGYADGAEEPVIGDPIGREALLAALNAEMIPYTPEELIEIANREFAWCDVEMKRAAHDLGFGDDWHKALAHVSSIRANPGDQPRLIKDLADEAANFVEERNLVTIPPLCRELWRMEMMSVERQKVNPYFTGGEVISISYPTDAMAYEDKMMSMRGNNPAFCRATVFHELIPGHHLQIFMAQRYNAHRRLFTTPFLVEGWALYWEMRMWDLKFPRTPEERVGMLFWRSHRCARIIFSLKFHLGQMTAPEAIDFLVEKIGHERRNATAEVRRSVIGTYSPLYQAAYMLGGLQLRALHHDLVDSGKMAEKQFHDAVLKENAIPIDMIRSSLTGEKLTPDHKPSWRFYDPIR
jgi:hypothetical protein